MYISEFSKNSVNASVHSTYLLFSFLCVKTSICEKIVKFRTLIATNGFSLANVISSGVSERNTSPSAPWPKCFSRMYFSLTFGLNFGIKTFLTMIEMKTTIKKFNNPTFGWQKLFFQTLPAQFDLNKTTILVLE